MSNILVTGAAGFIGHKVVEKLLRGGHDVTGIDNFNDYYDPRLKELRSKYLKEIAKAEGRSLTLYRLDIEHLGALKEVFQHQMKMHHGPFTAVINLAARAGVRYSMENPFVYLATNATGTLNLLELMREYQCKKIVLASTSSLYAGLPMPFNEESAVNTPISPYAATKKAAEVMAYSYHYLYGIDASVVRYFTVYGQAGRPDMCVFRFIKWIDAGTPITLYGDGTQTRDFTFVDDIAEGTVRAMQPLESGYEIINLGGGREPTSLLYVINKIEEYLEKRASIDYRPFNKVDLTDTMADVTKAYRLLGGWRAEVGIDKGLRMCVDWYLQNRELVRSMSV
ncbi:MAG: GDP-mannose 4,6-dehydratase [Oligoflexia bacterium]|nr:GDP-mannose 4,6-dehydratase [Oligoflexia bacterium]